MIRTFIKGVKVLCTNRYTTALFMDHKTRIELAPSVWKTEILTIILLMDMVVKVGHCTYKVLRHQFYRLTRYYLRSTSRLLALTEGFEPPRLLHPSVFKTDTSTTLSSQHLFMAWTIGLGPTHQITPITGSLANCSLTIRVTSTYFMVPLPRFEQGLMVYKTIVLSCYTIKAFLEGRIRFELMTYNRVAAYRVKPLHHLPIWHTVRDSNS